MHRLIAENMHHTDRYSVTIEILHLICKMFEMFGPYP